MNRNRLEQLVWERIDGTILPDDLSELEAHLAEHPEPRQVEREILRLAELLDNRDDVPSPAELRSRIDKALSESPGPAERISTPTPSSRRRIPLWMPMAASLALGIAIGVMLQIGGAGSVDERHATGSMTTPAPVAEPEMQVFNLGEGIGRVSARREGSLLTFDVVLETAVEVELVLANTDGTDTVLTTTGPGTRRLVHDGQAPGHVVARIDGADIASHDFQWGHAEGSP